MTFSSSVFFFIYIYSVFVRSLIFKRRRERMKRSEENLSSQGILKFCTACFVVQLLHIPDSYD